MTLRLRVTAVTLAVCAGLGGVRLAGQAAGLTGAQQIGRVYDAILDARFEQVPALLQQTCRPTIERPSTTQPHPAVCQLLDLVALWWQIQLDPLDTSRDTAFERKATEVIASIEAWTRVEPQRAEAWFYLGGAYGARGQWRVLRGELLSAARDGKRIKDSLERSLALDPNLKDAYFGIGLYHYYADVAPAAAKVLRFLLFLPGGNKEQGMREMLEARNGGQLLRSEADYQLHVLYLWYERQPLRAREIVMGLRERYPRNPHFAQVIAEIDDTYLHDDTATLRAWQSMLQAARDGRLAAAAMAETRARLGIARQLDRLHEPDAALDQLRTVLQSSPTTPAGASAQASLQLGQVLDQLGQRTEAVQAYRQAIAAAGRDPLKVTPQAREGLRTTPTADTTRAYRLSIEGWRAFERGSLTDAERALTQSLSLRPDGVARYRLARVRIAQNNPAAALALLQQITSGPSAATPPVFYGYACLDAATILEQMGESARALDLYSRASALFGADERTKDAATRAHTRLSPSRPAPRE